MTQSDCSPRATRWMLSKELRNAFFQFFPARTGHMRGQDDIVQAKQLVLGGRRLLDHDIEPGPADAIRGQRIVERILIDHRAAAGVDQDRRLLHHCQLALADHLVGVRVERHVQSDDVRAVQ